MVKGGRILSNRPKSNLTAADTREKQRNTREHGSTGIPFERTAYPRGTTKPIAYNKRGEKAGVFSLSFQWYCTSA